MDKVNETRVARALNVLSDYSSLMLYEDDVESSITDLTVDLMHLAASRGLDAVALNDLAQAHFIAETATT